MKEMIDNLRFRAKERFHPDDDPEAINYESLGAAVECSPNTVRNLLEHYSGGMRVKTFRKLCYLLDVPFDKLIIEGQVTISGETRAELKMLAQMYIKENGYTETAWVIREILCRSDWRELNSDHARVRLLLPTPLPGETPDPQVGERLLHFLRQIASDAPEWAKHQPAGREVFRLFADFAHRGGNYRTKWDVIAMLEEMRQRMQERGLSPDDAIPEDILEDAQERPPRILKKGSRLAKPEPEEEEPTG